MSRNVIAMCAALALGGLIPSMAQGAPNLVTNPGFESGTVGWTFAGCAGVVTGGGSDPHTGSWAAYVNFEGAPCGAPPPAPADSGFIMQSIATTPGDLYAVSFWLDTLSGFGDLSASFGADVGYSATSPDIPYTNITFDAVATSSSSLFQFAGINVSGTKWIDDVSVMDLGPVTPPVPEPGSLALLSGALAGLCLIRHRDRR